jgi:hypothetical protein
MYSRFLRELARHEATVAEEAAERWTSLAGALFAASERERADPDQWSRVSAEAARVLDAEERLWLALAGDQAAKRAK